MQERGIHAIPSPDELNAGSDACFMPAVDISLSKFDVYGLIRS